MLSALLRLVTILGVAIAWAGMSRNKSGRPNPALKAGVPQGSLQNDVTVSRSPGTLQEDATSAGPSAKDQRHPNPTETDPTKPPDTAATSSDQAAPKKDFWDKIGTLTTLISSVVIGAAGVAATYLYNNRELDIKHLEKQQEEARLDAQEKANAQVQLTKRLEDLYKFVASPTDRERTFGYAMFKALGEESLAATIIASIQDKAGISIAEGIVRDELTRYKSYLESVGFSDLQANVRLIAFGQNDVQGTVPSEFRDIVLSEIKENIVSFYYQGVMFVQNDWVDRPFVPLREYTHYALSAILKKDVDQTSIESGLADYYPASFLDPTDTSLKGPAGVDLSFLEQKSPAVSALTPPGPGTVVYQGRFWAASFWECRKKLSRSTVDSLLLRAWVQSYEKGADAKGEVDRFRDALLTGATTAEASCFRDALTRRGLLKS
jgi:hypothetical protein